MELDLLHALKKKKSKASPPVAQVLWLPFLRPSKNNFLYLHQGREREMDHHAEAPPTALSPNHKACTSRILLSQYTKQGPVPGHQAVCMAEGSQEGSDARLGAACTRPPLSLPPAHVMLVLAGWANQPLTQCPPQSPGFSSACRTGASCAVYCAAYCTVYCVRWRGGWEPRDAGLSASLLPTWEKLSGPG